MFIFGLLREKKINLHIKYRNFGVRIVISQKGFVELQVKLILAPHTVRRGEFILLQNVNFQIFPASDLLN